MSARGGLAALVALAALVREPPTVRADGADLEVKQLPAPRPAGLTMRGRLAVAASAAPRPAGGARIDDVAPLAAARRRADDELVGPTSTREDRVVFRFNLGFGIDGGAPSGDPMTSGAALDERQSYERLRSYGLGDVALGSRGMLSPALNTYLGATFRFDQATGQPTTAVPSVRDGGVSDLVIHSGYAEVEGFLTGRLRPLFLRAGRQYRYGVGVAQFDGVSVGYESAAVSITAFGGERVFNWGDPCGELAGCALDDSATRQLGGYQLRLDLFEMRRLPLVVTLSSLTLGDSSHSEGGVALRWSPDVLVRASLRTRDGEAARQALSLWARLSAVSTLTVELDHRNEGDWMYDLLLAGRGRAASDLRRHLDLGAPLPRTSLDLRAGTVLLRNLDVVIRAGLGVDHHDADHPPSPYTASYLETGGAVEVRLRRNLRLGTHVNLRRYQRDAPIAALDSAAADPLPTDGGALGERTAYDGGARVHYSAGARRFNAWAELYGRAFELPSPWLSASDDTSDLRTGSRFGVEGWAGKRLRVRGEYDVSLSRMRYAPELLGVKSLRILAEGSF